MIPSQPMRDNRGNPLPTLGSGLDKSLWIERTLHEMKKLRLQFTVWQIAVNKETGKTELVEEWTNEESKNLFELLSEIAIMQFNSGVLRAAAPEGAE